MIGPARTTRASALTVAGVVAITATAACAAPAATPQADVTFDTAFVWIRAVQDSVRLRVELAESPDQHEVGLSGRASLDRDAGMLFVFDSQRYRGDGFQMWRTRMPLDIAFIDGNGVIVRILSMEPCAEARPEDCPGYYPGVEYMSALEVNRGWFDRAGVGVNAVARLER